MAKKLRWKVVTAMLLCVVAGVLNCGVREVNAETYETEDGMYEYMVLSDDRVEITGYSGEATEIEIPSEIDGKSVTSIGNYTFYGCSSLKSIEIPAGVTLIRWAAFSGCSSLESIEMPNGMTSIEPETFYGCSSLESIEIPDSVTSIGDLAFHGCSNLESIEIPAGVASIGYGVLFDCSNLDSIIVDSGNENYDSRGNCNAIIRKADNVLIVGCKNTKIPASVTSIGGGAFSSGLESIEIPAGVMSIASGAFEGCSNLDSIIVDSDNENYDSRDNCNAIIRKADNVLIVGCKNTKIPNNVTSIGYGAFEGCDSLESINIPTSVTSIGGLAFAFCRRLESIEIPAGVTSIEQYAFYGCSNLDSIIVDSGNENYDSRDNCNAIIAKESNTLIVGCKNTKIPASVTGIGGYAFYGCSSLESIEIPDSITGIGLYAFEGCSRLKSIEIPDSVTYIIYGVFEGCSSLKSITIPKSVIYIESSAFDGCPEDLVIYTVKGSYAEQWAKDNNITVELLDGDTTEKPDNTGDSGTTKNPNTTETPTTGDDGQKDKDTENQSTLPAVGTKQTVSNGVYKVTKSSSTNKEVTFTKPKSNKKTSLTIPATVKIDGQTYKVTEVEAKAFKNNKKLKSVTIGKNVKKIGKEAFSGSSKLNKITIKSTVLKSVGKNAIKGINAKATIKCPKKQLEKYKKLFKSSTGYKKSMKIKK